MSNEYQYVDQATGKPINNGIAINGGVIQPIDNSTAIRYIPGNRVNIKLKDTDGEYASVSYPPVVSHVDTYDYSLTSPSASKSLGVYRRYRMGIREISVRQEAENKINGFISKEIDIGNCSYIELDVKSTGVNPVEYSIIEGLKETPIRPNHVKRIVDEKLFSGLPLRFESSGAVTVKENGNVTTLNIDNKNTFDYDSSIYTASYTPTKDAYRYFSGSNKIKIKVIQRCELSTTPTTIQSISIVRYGGEKIWTQNS